MRTTQKLHAELKKVEPTKSLLVISAPCEDKAAHIHNEAVIAVNQQDMPEVVRRFKQSQSGEGNSMFQATIMPVMLVMLIKCIIDLHESIHKNHQSNLYSNSLYDNIQTTALILFTACAVFAGLMIPPNISNTLRYRQTKNECANWLTQRLDSKTFNDLANIERKETSSFYETRIRK